MSLAFLWPESGLAATLGLQVPPRTLVLLDLPEAKSGLKKGIYLDIFNGLSQLTSTPLFMKQSLGQCSSHDLLLTLAVTLNHCLWVTGVFDKSKFSSHRASLALWLALTVETGTWRTRK